MAYYPVDRPNDMVVHGLGNARPGLHAVGEYQVAGRPFVKTLAHGDIGLNILADNLIKNANTETKISFPTVSSRLIVTNNTGGAIAVYFCSVSIADANDTDSGVKINKNYYVLPAPAAATPMPTLDIKVKSRYIYIAGYGNTVGSGTVSVAAELTSIKEDYDTNVDDIVGISG